MSGAFFASRATLILAFVLSMSFADATVELSSPSGGAAVSSRDMVFSFTFYPDNTSASNPMCAFYLDGAMLGQKRLTTSNSSSFSATNMSRKAHEWWVSCEDAMSGKRTLTVLALPPPNVTLVSPQNAFTAANGTVDYSFVYQSGADELPSALCSLGIGVSFKASANATSGARTTIRYTLLPGEYGWLVRCARNESGKFVEAEPRVIRIPEIKIPPKPAPKNEGVMIPIADIGGPALFNLTVNASGSASSLPRLVAPHSSFLGDEIPLKLMDGDFSPIPRSAVRVRLPDGSDASAGTTDAQGMLSFYPNLTGKYEFYVPGSELAFVADVLVEPLPSSQEALAAIPKNEAPDANALLEAQRSQITVYAIGGVALLFVIAVALLSLLLGRKPPAAAPAKKVELTEVKGSAP